MDLFPTLTLESALAIPIPLALSIQKAKEKRIEARNKKLILNKP